MSPKKTKQDLIRKGRKYSPEEVLGRFESSFVRGPKTYLDFDGDSIKMGSHRYWTFAMKGIQCESCGIKGQYFYKERHHDAAEGTYHFNLYAVGAEGQEVLMTKAHVRPRSKGGRDHITNYQTLCVRCSWKRRDP